MMLYFLIPPNVYPHSSDEWTPVDKVLFPGENQGEGKEVTDEG